MTTYGYDALGRQSSVTDPLTNTVTTAYDAEGHVVSQRGATYPVDYAYDEFGDKVSMTTYRDINAAGDVTRWLRDEATGLVTNKVYADGKGPRYDYTPDGKLATRTWARGIVTTYSYDDNGSLTNTVYSDGTPTISLAYNRAGRQVQAIDAAGVTTFLYDAFGAVTNETVIGVAGTNTIERYYDSFGRSLGYAFNGVRKSTLAYDPATGRLAMMLASGSDTPFAWSYIAGSDLKSSLAYPNGLTASWTYDANGQLLQVKNAFPTNTISQYDYAYDAGGRRINVSKSGTAFNHDDTIAYGYNARSELTNAVAAVDSDYRYAYDFDDIGNRETSCERGTNVTYTANNLNQYAAVDDFTPQFDDDGNQTLVKTSTGIWSVTYNGENRPTLWSCIQSNNSNNTNNQTILTMSYDRMGRRVTKNAQRFVYDGHLQIANFEHSTSNIKHQTFIWDPTEPIATRPLVWNSSTFQPFNFSTSYYTHDGNKNVSEVVTGEDDVSVRYMYAPFGATVIQFGASAAINPWRFSSEYAERDTATVYYNYRCYDPVIGRWLSRDPTMERASACLYAFNKNFVMAFDYLGRVKVNLVTKKLDWGFWDKVFGASGTLMTKPVGSVEDIYVFDQDDESRPADTNPSGRAQEPVQWVLGMAGLLECAHVGEDLIVKGCDIEVSMSIVLRKNLGKGSKRVTYIYQEHEGTDVCDFGYQRADSTVFNASVIPRDAVLAHERGHAKEYISFIGEFANDVKDMNIDKLDMIRKKFSQAYLDNQDRIFEATNEPTKNWFSNHGYKLEVKGK